MNTFLDWLDHRTGARGFVHEALYERIPGGARWRYVWGSTLVFTFAAQMITGFFLWMAYSPSAQTAWESVYWIQYQMWGGWFVRGLHHFTAQAMVVLLAIHLLQVIIDGAYRAPREVNFWLGLILMQIVLGLSLTGYLLPWDQKGYWATRVATNLMGLVPVVGESLQRVVVGGADYGHHTLTRFFALHAGLLPLLLIVFLVLHVALFRRHGICAKSSATRPDGYFWPEQVLKDAIACFAVLTIVVALVMWPGFTANGFQPHRAGAELLAPADGSEQFSAARPEWYFLFLFQLLKYFPGKSEIVGAIVLPGAVMLLLVLMPIIGRWRIGHALNVVAVCALLLVGIAPLTILAWREDRQGPEADGFALAVANARLDAERAVELAGGPDGISPLGALSMLRSDVKTRGKRLFGQHCAPCHGKSPVEGQANDENFGAPDLGGFASRVWIGGLLDAEQIAGPKFFGHTKHRESDMAGFVRDDLKSWPKEEVESVVMALSAEASLKSQAAADQKEQQRIEAGRALIRDDSRGCVMCHKFHDAGESESRPDLTNYGSRQWLIDFISNPSHPRFYPGEANDRMPAFGEQKLLSPEEIGVIADWLRGDWWSPSDDAKPDVK